MRARERNVDKRTQMDKGIGMGAERHLSLCVSVVYLLQVIALKVAREEI